MGLLVDGKWQDKWYDTDSTGGKFKRSAAQFRNWIEADSNAKFPAQSGRYHLYVSYACPWAHRTLIFRQLKGLEQHITVSVVHPLMLENGWEFAEQPLNDDLYSLDFLYQLYLKADSEYSGRVTVPVLWDKQQQTIVSNESADIIRMFNSAFNDITGNTLDFYPEKLQQDIDSINDYVYDRVNNGVYKCGFATQQTAYEEAFEELFEALDKLEERLATQSYLVGETLTEADWRLFTTLVRFDSVYVGHFKTNKRRIVDYPNLWNYVKALYQVPGIAETVVMDHIKQHYYGSHHMINPTGVVPVGPQLDFLASHTRKEVVL
ncbi:glutathione S-transferase family protein [Pseudidiomarina andamanensis]|uniref:Glutathione S-transferase family protein n=1 Tax=Pseudidiomarina andamanensis TaxID=1940690 RepID=A0AA92EQP2_9GAMM|nr:glutathione S-transferase family protein [Pseudidiomarina andamanensis]MDS0218190.1 glutathione S-transferase family protein [Pseudidiomarina andamanensis]QGT95077.1 glutathione S-transferase family protein [Pseudidiomarina andamanensis]